MKKQIYVILTVLLFNSCTLPKEKKCYSKFKLGDIITFRSDTTINGIITGNTESCMLYKISYFDRHGVSRFDRFYKNEIISKKKVLSSIQNKTI